jgi:hypothetical protein
MKEQSSESSIEFSRPVSVVLHVSHMLALAVIGRNSYYIVVVLISCSLCQYSFFIKHNYLQHICACAHVCVCARACMRVICKLLAESFSVIQDFGTKSEIVEAIRPTPDLPQFTGY